MSERCDLSDLPPEMCGCRVHAPQADDARSTNSKPFPAKYFGRCRECGEPIEVGDMIVSVGYAYFHEECS